MSSCRSSAASLRSCMSRIARAWISSMSSSPIRPCWASAADALARGTRLPPDPTPLPGAAAAPVLEVGDPADPAAPDQLGDLLRQVVRVDLVRQLLDDQAGAAARVLLDLDHGPHDDRAAPGAVGVPD